MIDNKNNNDSETAARFIKILNKIFCNKKCCADYVRFILNKPDGRDADDLGENIASNIELVKKSANKDYDKKKVPKNATDTPKPKKFLAGGEFFGLPNEIKSAYLEKYFEIVDGGNFDYTKTFSDNLKDMIDKYKDYPEGVFLHILRLRLENFEKKQKPSENKSNVNEDFSSKKNLATAIKRILNRKNLNLSEKKLAVLWEYYEYFNGIDEDKKLGTTQDKFRQFEDALEKITNSDDYTDDNKSDSISNAIITGKLKAYGIDTIFKADYIEILNCYSDEIKIAAIESFKSATSCSNYKNKESFDDICYGERDYKNLSSAVRAKIIDKLSNNGNATGVFLSMNIFDFIEALKKHYYVDMKSVNPEILVALFKLFLNSPISICANITQVLTAISEIQKQTNNFEDQVDLDSGLLKQLSCDSQEQSTKSNEQLEQLTKAQLKESIPHFFGKIFFCLVFFVVAIPTLLIRWTLRFLWGILGWFINMFYCNWRRINNVGQGFKNLDYEFFGFFLGGLVGAVARRWFISDPLAIRQIFKNLWYRFFGKKHDMYRWPRVYVTGFIVWTGNKKINGKDLIYRNDSHVKNFGVGDYFKFMSGYSEVINKSEAEGYPEDNVPLQSRLENINTDPDFSPFRYY